MYLGITMVYIRANQIVFNYHEINDLLLSFNSRRNRMVRSICFVRIPYIPRQRINTFRINAWIGILKKKIVGFH
jgi:hypothetical protein